MRALASLSALLALGCTGQATLVVQVRTDLTPLVELASVETRVGEDVHSVTATREQRWGDGVRVAELAGLAPERLSFEVRALDAEGRRLVSRPVRVELRAGANVVTVLLTRACGAIECPAAGDAPERVACVAGRCVEAECSEESPAACGAPACGSADECPMPASPCGTRECTASGACFVELDASLCAGGDVCSPAGCVPPCPVRGPFGPPVELMEIAGISLGDPEISEDGRILLHAQEGPSRIFEAIFDAARGEYVPSRELTELRVPPIEILSGPALREDGLELVFRAYDGISDDLWVATRASAGDAFDPPVRIDALSGGSSEYCPELSADGLEVYFTSTRAGGTRLWHARRASRDTIAFEAPTVIAEIAEGECPTISADGRKLAFGLDGDLYLAERASSADPFGAPAPIAELNTASAEGTPDFFDGGRAIVFASDRDGDGALYLARRTCAP